MQFKRVMERNGVQGWVPRNEEGNGRTTTSLNLHSLRETCISRLANGGVAGDVRMKLVANQTKAIRPGYTRLELDTFKSALFAELVFCESAKMFPL